MRIGWLLIGWLLSACATAAPASQASLATTEPAPEPATAAGMVSAEPREPPAPAAASVVTTPVVRESPAGQPVLGVIEREGLVAIVDAGLGRLFQRLQVSPALKKGRFVGFRITSMHPHWSAAALQTGDVITALNGMPIERPEQAMAAFESLRQSEQLVVDLLREDAAMTVRYRIE